MFGLGMGMTLKRKHESGTIPLSHKEFKIINKISNPLLDTLFKNVMEIRSSPVDGKLRDFRETDSSIRLNGVMRK